VSITKVKNPHNIMTGKKVLVTGDRARGLYEVEIGKRFRSRDIMEKEICYCAIIVKTVEHVYDYKKGQKVFVLRKENKKTFGEINPFIGKKEF